MDPDRALLSPQELRATAELAGLLVTDAELAQLCSDLSAVLAYVAELGEIDIAGVPPMTHAVALPCPLRADAVGPHDPVAGALRNAPATQGAFFSVPAILANSDSAASTRDQRMTARSKGAGRDADT